MKTFRKNIDLDAQSVAILQIEATLNGHGSLKPFLESIIVGYASKCEKSRSSVYKTILSQKLKSIKKVKKR